MNEITAKDLKAGDIILCVPNILKIDGWIGQAIVMLTSGLASHTAVYCGEIEGVQKVAHSNLAGTHYDSLDYFTKNHAGFFVRRYTQNKDLSPVLAAVDRYMHKEKPDPYPIADLVLLGVLVLGKKFLNKTTPDRIIYDFAVLLTVLLMKEINKRYYTQQSMTCSQFAAQCYTDAKDNYDIKFSKLFIQFDNLNDGQNCSLLEFIKEQNGVDPVAVIENQAASYLKQENIIIDDFIKFMNGETGLSSSTENVNESNLSVLGTALLWILHKIRTGQYPKSTDDALKQFYTNRNYLVMPDDLLFNATNLTDIGYAGRKLF